MIGSDFMFSLLILLVLFSLLRPEIIMGRRGRIEVFVENLAKRLVRSFKCAACRLNGVREPLASVFTVPRVFREPPEGPIDEAPPVRKERVVQRARILRSVEVGIVFILFLSVFEDFLLLV